MLTREMGIDGEKGLSAPGVKTPKMPEDENAHMEGHTSTKFRRYIARCNFIALDKPDIQYAVKEVAKGMS